ncbi:hypothetical protein COLO4_15543 [Corchorus olitorius]|uniref:Transposase, Ptta/En/Spm, plant n=1 Tax=Corchorus olitorius TaxID=93759 RepID=A0A1R3JME8_9ROSI|nr:hypothetical protein COLO4_15543 [Corchorus olitorius]
MYRRSRNIVITSAPQPPADEGGNSSTGGTLGLDIPKADYARARHSKSGLCSQCFYHSDDFASDDISKLVAKQLRPSYLHIYDPLHSPAIPTKRTKNFGYSSDTKSELVDERGSIRRRRGKTRLAELAKLKPGKRVVVNGNNFGQRVGDSTSLMTGYMGKLAKNGKLLPINALSWRNILDADKERVVQRVKDKFFLTDVPDKYIRKSIGKKWRDHKSILKKRYFDINKTPQAVKADWTAELVQSQWEDLVDY